MKRNQTAPLGLVPGGDMTPADSNGAPGGVVYDLDKWLARQLLKAASNPPISIILWDGQEITLAATALVGKLILHDRGSLYKLLLHPDLQLGELLTSGRVRIEGDLVEMLEALSRTLPSYEERGVLVNLLNRFYLLKRNTQDRARDNICHHYDIGNDFYRLWLDEQLVYTCAYFPDPTMSLEAAQVAKLDHVCRKLRLQPGETVVEAGCGWGALALHMARHYGVTVKAYNISKEQLAYARERAQREGLHDRVEYIEGDYRTITDEFDAFASVGMLEHVGLNHFHELGEVMNRVLKPNGRGLIHSIGRNQPAPMNAWIEKRVFPGAYPPSLGEMMQLFEPWHFSVLDVENLRLHYAETLRHWLHRYDASAERVLALFDPAFFRAWRFYLAGSIAAFTTGHLQLFQVVFTRHDNNALPWSREYIYRTQGKMPGTA